MTETTTPEFNLADILSGVKQTQTEVTLYLDAQAADRAVALRNAIDAYDPATAPARSVGDPTPQQEFDAAMEELEANALKVNIRALSNFENTKVREKVITNARVDKKLSKLDREQLLSERETELYIHYLSLAIVDATFTKTGAKKAGMSVTEVEQLQAHLPEIEWFKLVREFLVTQTKISEFEEALQDPTFRGSSAE